MLRTCKKCNEQKPQTKEYFPFTYRYKKDKSFLFLEHTCKACYAKYQKIYKNTSAYTTLDGMIEFAQSLGFRSASYAIDKYGIEQFKQMYYESIRI